MGLDEADTEVLRYPVKSKNKSTNKMIELMIPAGIQLSDKLNLPEKQHPALVDTGAQIEVLAGEELFPQEALLDAPNPVQLITVGRKPLSGGRKGVIATVRVLAETPDGLQVYKCVPVFIHVAAIGPRLIIGFPFLLRYGLAVVPGKETLVSVGSFLKHRKPAYQHGKHGQHGLSDEVGVDGAQIEAHYGQAARRVFKWVPSNVPLHPCLVASKYEDGRTRAGKTSESGDTPSVSFNSETLSYVRTECMQPRCWRPTHLVFQGDSQLSTTGLCMFCHESATGEPVPDWARRGIQQHRKGVRRAVNPVFPADIDGEEHARLIRAALGVNSLKANYTRSKRRASLPIQQYRPETPTIPSQDIIPITSSLSPSVPFSSSCMFPSLMELVSTHISSHPFQVKRLRPESVLPTRGTPGSAGYDLYAAVEVEIPPRGQKRVPTGLAFTTPILTYGKVQDRSGNAAKLFLRTKAGVIDTDYTGEVDVLLTNMNSEGHTVRIGDKIAQLTLELHLTPEIQEVTELQVTKRGSRGFGSTDIPSNQVIPSPGKPHTRSQPEGAHISGVTQTKQSFTCAQEKCLLLCAYISSLLAAYNIPSSQGSPESPEIGSAVHQALGLVCSLTKCLVSAFPHRPGIPSRVDSADGGSLVGTGSYPPVPVQETQALIPVRRPEAVKGDDMDIGSSTLLADVHAEFTGTGPELVEVETTGSTLTGLDAPSGLATEPIPRPALSGWGEARIKSAPEHTELRAVACDGLVFTDLDLWADSEQSESETGPWPSLDVSTSEVLKTNALSKSPGVPKSSTMVQRGRGTVIQIRASARRKARQKWREDRDDLAVRQDAVYRIERWAKSLVADGHFKDFTDVFSSKRLARFPKFWDKTKDGLSQPWSGENLWLHPPDELWEQKVQKFKLEQGQGIAIVTTCKDRDWWWSLSEVVVDWRDVPRGEPLFVDKYGKVCSADREYRVVLVDALGWTPDESESESPFTSSSYTEGAVANQGETTTSHPHPKPSVESLLHDCHNNSDSSDEPDRQISRQTRRRAVSQAHKAQKKSQQGDTSQSESELSPGPIFSSSDESTVQQKRHTVTHPPVINPTRQDRNTLGPAETTRHSPPQGYRRYVRSAIQSDEDWAGCEELKEKFMNRYEATVFRPIRTQDVTEKAKKARGPRSTLKLELLPEHAGPRADKPIRAVGERKKALWEKIVKFKDRGMLRDAKGQPEWVARAFLVPKPGKNEWRLVIDYRHLNSCLKGNSFPLPVIEDQIANQQRNFIFTIIDLEDGFHQMHLEEESKHLTAFCTLFGIFEWNVLPMGVKVGPAAYQQMVQYVTRNCPQSRPYIDDILSSTGSKVIDPGKLTIEQKQEPETLRKYFEAHYEDLCKLFDAVEEAQLTVKPSKVHLFKRVVQYVGHILKDGCRFPSPTKISAVKEWKWESIVTAKHMKGFLGLMGWYQVYIKGFAELAAPLIDALKGKYQYEPKDPNEPKTATGVPKKRKKIKAIAKRSSYQLDE